MELRCPNPNSVIERSALIGSLCHLFSNCVVACRPVSPDNVRQEVAKTAETFIEFPPLQKGESFNMEALKQALIEKDEPSWQLVAAWFSRLVRIRPTAT
jgi:hypothetical protein